jgi:flagellar basal-body rod protein FlgF/flagellar basal-body rod protein FlgG
MEQGALEHTGNPLDLAIEGLGFFAIQTPNGIRYTRDGSFHRGPNGQLVTAAGEPVLSQAGQSIPVPPGEVSVGSDGALSVAGGIVARVGLFDFPNRDQITAEGANRYALPEGVTPVQANGAEIHQGAIENANQDAIHGSLQLLLMQRQAETMQKALTVFHTEFNKFAAEELPRV